MLGRSTLSSFGNASPNMSTTPSIKPGSRISHSADKKSEPKEGFLHVIKTNEETDSNTGNDSSHRGNKNNTISFNNTALNSPPGRNRLTELLPT